MTVYLPLEVKEKVLPRPDPPPFGLQSKIQTPAPPGQPHTQVTHTHAHTEKESMFVKMLTSTWCPSLPW